LDSGETADASAGLPQHLEVPVPVMITVMPVIEKPVRNATDAVGAAPLVAGPLLRVIRLNPNEVRAPPRIGGWGMTEYLITLAMIGIVIILTAGNCA